MCLAFGVEKLDDVARRLEDVLEMQPPQGLVEKVKGLGRLKQLADSVPKVVRSGRCQELVLEPDLDQLPIQHCWPGDPAPFITLPAVITKDPQTGARNVGMYRMQKIDAQHDVHALADPQGRRSRLAGDGRAARSGRRARARSRHGVLGKRAACRSTSTSSCSPASSAASPSSS